MALETGTHSPWLNRQLAQLGHEVIVAHARNVRLIGESSRKDDQLDARASRLPGSILGCWVRCDIAVPKCDPFNGDPARAVLVGSRTALVNAARGLTKSYGQRLQKCGTEQMNRESANGISEELWDVLKPLLIEIEWLNERIAEYDRRIEQIAKEVYPEVAGLKQVKGVGPLIGLTFVLTDLRRFGLKLAERGGKNAKKRAIVAVARKLAVLFHNLWVSGEVYEPRRNNPQMRAAVASESGDPINQQKCAELDSFAMPLVAFWFR